MADLPARLYVQSYARIRIVGRSPQKLLVLERGEHHIGSFLVETPEALHLRLRQVQARHLTVFSVNHLAPEINGGRLRVCGGHIKRTAIHVPCFPAVTGLSRSAITPRRRGSSPTGC